jgi:CBS domain-containing protein
MNETIERVLADKGDTVEAVAPDTSVLRAVERMNECHIGSLVVCDGERPVGIFTERDVLVRVVARGLDPKRTPVGEVMTRELIAIRPDVTVTEAMLVITERRCRHLPVVDDRGLRGLISIGDLTRWIVRDREQTIEDLYEYLRRG